ncbi:SCO family protein [Amycolatopsis sp. GM8]|uniref:SCO family protein n=1 Tax=Amycolatopsis sp. GM8 TaxID=2896530 RepID=UPI001F3E163D|nr:SCO family protein [Amycolatopsis sp. GM8]
MLDDLGPLVDHHGRDVTEQDFLGRYQLVDAGRGADPEDPDGYAVPHTARIRQLCETPTA